MASSAARGEIERSMITLPIKPFQVSRFASCCGGYWNRSAITVDEAADGWAGVAVYRRAPTDMVITDGCRNCETRTVPDTFLRVQTSSP